jgi:hypothetical protein
MEIKDRYGFGDLLKHLGLHGRCVEVGVWCGTFSDVILSWKSGDLVLVDLWKHLEDFRDIANLSDVEFENIYAQVKAKYANNSGVIILRMASAEASQSVADNSCVFVFIDANHDKEHALADMKAWYPKVIKGGILSGHDCDDAVNSNGVYGVKSALAQFMKELNRTDSTILSDGSWYIIK